MESLYIMHNPISHLFKIGITTNIKERLRKIQCESGCPVYVIQQFNPPQYKEEERKLHKQYKQHRKIGEWFNLTLEHLEEIYTTTPSPFSNNEWNIPTFIAENYEPEDVQGINQAWEMVLNSKKWREFA